MVEGVKVSGLRELNRALKHADAQVRGEFRAGWRAVAEPVRADAERLAVSEITNMTAPWARMRVGVTRKLVYVAPRQRGVKARGDGRRRPNLAGLLMERAMAPALARNEDKVVAGVERLLDRVGRDFNEGV